MEDVVDTFLVHVEGPDPPSRRRWRKFSQKMKNMLPISGKRHQIGEQINDIKERVMELAARRDRYKVDTVNPVATLDPRIGNIYFKATDLVGINGAKEKLIMKLTKGDEMSMQKQMIVSIVGFGGLGKTTLAKVVFDEIKSQFDCTALVTVSQNPDIKKFLKDILHELGQGVHESLDERQLIDIVRRSLHNKRYLIIIDDIWNISHWDSIIKKALLDNNTGSRVITTTRNVTVANHIGCAYSMQPLSPDNSRVLLYRRIFGNEDLERCLDDNLTEVSDRILKKCAGVPLAIITIASLLASRGRNKAEWDEVCNSIGNGMENSLDAENMRKILSYSYYDLSPSLRTCLLYLSIFPEDFEIEKDRLIWLWTAEGFIQHEKQWKKSLFELGERYFNELINRSMIQPTGDVTRIVGCRVHDMVLDLILSISSEENFVNIISNMDQTSPSTMTRRLSLQNGKTHHAMTEVTRAMPLVRSVVVFLSALDQMTSLRSFKVLRVLDLQGCYLPQDNLQYLGSLFHLRYLNLSGTSIDQLPEEVGNLQFLEVLDIRGIRIHQLPKYFSRLTHLLCLNVSSIYLDNGIISSLTSLEELTGLLIDDDSIKDLGLLTELRVLHFMLHTDELGDKLVESLCKLEKIQSLTIRYLDSFERNIGALDAWVVAPTQLRKLKIGDVLCFSTLPVWMNDPTQFRDLANLSIAMRELKQEDLVILGRLPALYKLNLEVEPMDLGIVGRRLVFGSGLFPNLDNCKLQGIPCPVVFQQGAMPRLRMFLVDFIVPEAWEFPGSDGGFDLGLGNLHSLQQVTLYVGLRGASEPEVEEAEAALRHAAEIHPNRPRLRIEVYSEDISSDSDDE